MKRSVRMASRSPRPSKSAATPPKAAVAAPQTPKEEVRRRRNPFNDMLKPRTGGTGEPPKDTPPGGPNRQHAPDVDNAPPPPSDDAIDRKPAERIADLERALAMAEEEQVSWREELAQAQTQRQADQDVIDDLRRQLNASRSNAENLPLEDSSHVWESTTYDAVQRESEELVRQNYNLRCRVAQLEELLVSPDRAQGTSTRPESSVDVQLRLHAAEKESQERLQQIISLKSSISSLTRMQSQATDSDLVASFSELANRFREWTVSNFRRTKPDFENIPKETQDTLRTIYPQYRAGSQGADKLALYQAIVSNSLMSVFESPLLFGLPASLAGLWSFADQVQNSGAAYGEWKRATIQVLECSKVEQDFAKVREQSLHRVLGDICHLLFTLTSINVSSSAQLGLSGILKQAVDLQRTLALQKAQYQLLFFRNQEKTMCFDDRTMEAINDVDPTMDDDSSMKTDRTFLFCAFPGLVKHGNEWGEHLEISNVLLKARVCTGLG